MESFLYICNMKCWRRLIRWCRGIGHGKGFGIQSPFAYDFVTTVINQSSPYYAYERLAREYPLTAAQQKDCRLLFRLANFLQPQGIGVSDTITRRCPSSPLFRAMLAHLQAGCCRSVVRGLRAANDLVLLTAASYQEQIRLTSVHSVVVICEIDHDDAWRALLSRSDVTFSFELYRLCILFFDTNFHHRHYLINY